MAAVKALQQWCRIQCEGYRDVSITNMTSSFRDGLAFCALIHKHRPELINFDSLRKENVYDNNKLAFKVAEEQLGIPALLDAEDMVALKVPDRLSILTYVSQYYNYFHGRSPIGGMAGVKRPAEGPSNEPCGKKNQAVSAKVFPSSKPARENSPPPSSNVRQPSPRQTRKNTQDVPAGKSSQTGTLSNKCVSCAKHVHLVQRHLVDGKLYHRNCAKSLSPTSRSTPPRDLPGAAAFSSVPPQAALTKTSTTVATPVSSRLGPTWLVEKPTTPSIFSTISSPSRPASGLSSPVKESQTAVISKPTVLQTTSSGDTRPTAAPRTSSQAPKSDDTPTTVATSFSNTRPTAAPRTSVAKTHGTTTATTSFSNSSPGAAPKTSTAAAKTLQSKLKFFQVNDDTNKNTNQTVDLTKGLNVAGNIQGVTAGQTVVGNVPAVGKKQANTNTDTGESAAGVGGKKQDDSESGKTKAAALISKKLAEENNNESKPAWTTVALKKIDKPSPAETPKKETTGVRGRVKLKADPSILADLQLPAKADTPKSGLSTASASRARSRTPDRGGSKPVSPSPSTAVTSDDQSPADWRSRLKPVSKETKPPGSSQLSPKSAAVGTEKSQTSDSSVRPLPSSHPPCPVISVTPPASKSFLNGQRDTMSNDAKSESKKTKPDFIPREDIVKELQEIEDNLNDLEKRGVELETKLRRSEEEGEDESLMDELMVEWFNLIKNKQVAMRRESELVYIGKTQDLEEQQPSVEQELRRLMEKPEHLKTSWDRKREEQLMTKLVEIVNDRNAIVEGLDEDRLREEEEDEQLNQMMLNFNIKKDKPKKKSPMSKLFSWANKKDS